MQHDRIAAEVGFMLYHFPGMEMGNFWMWNINEGRPIGQYLGGVGDPRRAGKGKNE